MAKFTLIFGVLWLAWSPAASTQAQTTKGIVWQPSTEFNEAARELRAIQNAGAGAVRTQLIRNDRLLTYADRLGLSLYVDLPISRLPALRLLDTLDYAAAVLDTALALARVHPSIRNIGLSGLSDTSDPMACAFYDELVRRARPQAPSGTQFYYSTRFIADDECSESVDFVLLDLVDHSDPIAAFRRWHESAETRSPAGIGALGTWVRSDTLGGLNIEHSPERQARYFETNLSPLLSGRIAPRPEAIFVFRWRDQSRDYPNPARNLEAPFVERYGLQTVDGTPRAAMEVVQGIYSGERTVFAFAQGTQLRRNSPWTTLLGWGLVLMLGIFYATSPRFRHMVPRYFQAHSFFLDSVREGRDVLFGASAALLMVLGVSTGILFSVALKTIRRTDGFVLSISWLPRPTQETVMSLISDPVIFMALAGLVYILMLLLWTFILALFTKRKYAMDPSQVLMLIVWTRWPILLLLAAAMVLAVTPATSVTSIALLVGAWLVVELFAAARTVFDLIKVSRIPAVLAIPCLLLHPVILLGIAAAISTLAYQPELTYVWHTFTRS